jgi:hypothetical protein
MRRLPSASKLAKELLATGSGKKKVGLSADYLLAHREDLKKYRTVEALVLSEDPGAQRLRSGVEYHLVQIRSVLARALWSRQLFIGVTVLDDLLFYAFAHSPAENPLESAIGSIRDHGLHHPGLIIYPVHSFGLLGAGFLHHFTDSRLDYTSSSFGIALTPQTNSLKDTLQFFERAGTALGVRRRIPLDLIVHWHRSRGIEWLKRNPLLVVRAQAFPGSYYENQFLLLTKLRTTTAVLSMLASIQPDNGDDDSRMRSSSKLNNWQTLDIHHYLVLYASPRSRSTLEGDCVPMNVTSTALAEISDLSFDLDPTYWQRQPEVADRIFKAASLVQDGYLMHSFGAGKESATGRLYRKFFHSLSFFRRSFQRADEDWSSIIALAIAFEMIFTDQYRGGVKERIVRRAELVFAAASDGPILAESVDALYRARGGIVHSGATNREHDLRPARRAFVMAFVELVERMGRKLPTSQTPIKDLCGDTLL